MNILVTGGAGFIGSRLVDALLKEGHQVRLMDNFMCGGHRIVLDHLDEVNSRQLTISSDDITNYRECLEACDGIQVVYHMAAMKSVPESLNIPLTYNKVNIDGTVKMLETCRQRKVPKFIFASSSAIYGNQETNVPILETLKPKPLSPYAVSKLAGEQYCRAYSYNYGLRTIALRFFNVYGPGQNINDGYAGVISKFIDAMVKGQRPKVFGDGKQIRDFVYVDDVIAALIAAKEPRNMRDFEEFNIGSGRGRSLLETIDIVNKELMAHIEPEFLPAQEGDIRTSVAEINKAEMYLGWKPKVSFPKGLLETIQYF